MYKGCPRCGFELKTIMLFTGTTEHCQSCDDRVHNSKLLNEWVASEADRHSLTGDVLTVEKLKQARDLFKRQSPSIEIKLEQLGTNPDCVAGVPGCDCLKNVASWPVGGL